MLTFKQLFELVSDDQLLFELLTLCPHSYDPAGRVLVDFPESMLEDPGGIPRSISDLLSAGYDPLPMIQDKPYTYYWGRTYFHLDAPDADTWSPPRPTLEPLEPGRRYPLQRLLEVCGPDFIQDMDKERMTLDRLGRVLYPLPDYEPRYGDPDTPRTLLKDLLEEGWEPKTGHAISFSGAGHTYIHIIAGAVGGPGPLPIDKAIANLGPGWVAFEIIFEEIMALYFEQEHSKNVDPDSIWQRRPRPTNSAIGRALRERGLNKKHSNGVFYELP